MLPGDQAICSEAATHWTSKHIVRLFTDSPILS